MGNQIQQILVQFDLLYQMELLFRIVVACFLGYIIGYERKSRDKSAGMRTHAIVALGAALMMVISKYGFSDIADYDASRVAAQIVSGIGFLGAGVIFVKNNSVSGLTTAAGIWTTAGIGMAVGAGEYLIGSCSAILVVAAQVILHKFSFIAAEPFRGYLKIVTVQFDDVVKELQEQFLKDKIKIVGMKVNKAKDSTKIELDLMYPAGYKKTDMITAWAKDKRIEIING